MLFWVLSKDARRDVEIVAVTQSLRKRQDIAIYTRTVIRQSRVFLMEYIEKGI